MQNPPSVIFWLSHRTEAVEMKNNGAHYCFLCAHYLIFIIYFLFCIYEILIFIERERRKGETETD